MCFKLCIYWDFDFIEVFVWFLLINLNDNFLIMVYFIIYEMISSNNKRYKKN